MLKNSSFATTRRTPGRPVACYLALNRNIPGIERTMGKQFTRRTFLEQTTLPGAVAMVGNLPLTAGAVEAEPAAFPATAKRGPAPVPVALTINGRGEALVIEPRVTLLDALRERLAMTGTKKGCDQGTCGACTVLVNGRRIKSCLTLAIMHEHDRITTIEGLARGDELHPMQAAFLEHDGFQCGYCTPGQIVSAVGFLKEKRGTDPATIREFMSGNICRCGAYTNIVDAVADAAAKGGDATL
jgi:xanthine dehydrogenase YagT iron-sulfur-binding subunit